MCTGMSALLRGHEKIYAQPCNAVDIRTYNEDFLEIRETPWRQDATLGDCGLLQPSYSMINIISAAAASRLPPLLLSPHGRRAVASAGVTLAQKSKPPLPCLPDSALLLLVYYVQYSIKIQNVYVMLYMCISFEICRSGRPLSIS